MNQNFKEYENLEPSTTALLVALGLNIISEEEDCGT